MDRDEARQVFAQEMADLTRRSYQELVDVLLNKPQTVEKTGPSGTRYQVELEAWWDEKPNGVLRVTGAIDDGGLRAFAPLTESLLVRPT